MTKKRSTKSALIASVISLLLCFTMLMGTTYAWFTDSVTSENNIIKSGNLDVELYWSNEMSTDDEDWEQVNATTNVFRDSALWEPGHTEVVYLKVVNEGSLALKYQLGVYVADEMGSTNIDGDPFTLSEHIMYGVIKDVKATYENRADAVKALGEDAKALNVAYLNNSKLDPKGKGVSKEYVALVIYMPETVGNVANAAKGAPTPTIDLGINLFATQQTSESDSFGNNYDADATLPWDGSVDTAWYTEADKAATEFVLSDASEVAGFASLVNEGDSFSGKTVKLAADIDLGDMAWTPIGACDGEAYFQGTFDGDGHTIYNLNVDKSTDGYQYSTAGLFGWVDAAAATVKNVNVDGATVKGSHWVGVIAGYWTGEISNCHVTNAKVIGYNVNGEANGDKVGGIVGYMNSGAGKLDGNSVSNSTVTGYRDVAGLAGAVVATNTVTNNKVNNVVVTYSTEYFGEIVSPKIAVEVDSTNVATDVTINRAVTVTTADELAEVMKSTEKNISVTLANDIAWNISTGNKLGGENT